MVATDQSTNRKGIMSLENEDIETSGERKRPLRLEIYRRKGVRRRWSWRLKSGNNVNWASPSKGFHDQRGAVESFFDMLEALGGTSSVIQVEVFDSKGRVGTARVSPTK